MSIVRGMTFGIDVSHGQSGINYAHARDEGVEFLIAKAAGFNTGTLYVASGYHAHVDGARAAGLAVGHYYVVGKGNPTTQANHFVDSLYGFDPVHDVLALDNEPLDGNPVFWHQDQVLEFLSVVQARTHIPWSRIWLYAPAGLTRTYGPWDKITDLDVQIWWAAYGGQPTGHTPDHTPALAGKISRWDIHQFSSSVKVAGYTCDANYSPASMADLFGVGSSTPASVPVHTVPKPPTPPKPPVPVKTSAVYKLPSHTTQARVQRALTDMHRYSGPADGVFGTKTNEGVQLTIRKVGYTGPIDGHVGAVGCRLIQEYAKKFGSYKGPVDGVLGENSWIGFALGLERK